MGNKKAKGIPYGIADYGRIVQRNYYYVDKTPFLETIEDAGEYLFFIRPRRFGKSLLLSLMEAYYDLHYKDRFEELFKDRAIFHRPTEERGAYLVLKFNFSAVDPVPANLEASFLNYVRDTVSSFAWKNRDLLKARDRLDKTLEQSRSPADILSTFVHLCQDSLQKLYVMIDEYDNFANTVLSTSGTHTYEDLTRGEGFFRAFFNVLKAKTSDMDAPITRLFITGVSPVTLDDVTSGFNIGKNVSLEPEFNRTLGFTEEDVLEMLRYYKGEGLVGHEPVFLLGIMKEWYGRYLFSEDDDVRMLNSDMVLYFMDHYLRKSKIPKDLVDRNVRIDYGKLRHLIIIDREKEGGGYKSVNGNFNRLKQVLEEGEALSRLQKGFPVEKLMETENFLSLLFYFGLLTIKEESGSELVLEVPNETVRRLFYDYIKEAYEETDVFSLDLSRYGRLMSDMAKNGQWGPLFGYISGRMRESLGLRDLITGEKAVQTFLNVYLGLSDLYFVHTEKELNRGYADIVLEPFLARHEDVAFSYLLEIKYIKKGDLGGSKGGREKKIEALKAAAEEQLTQYAIDKKFAATIGKTRLIKLALIFSGNDLLYIGEAK